MYVATTVSKMKPRNTLVIEILHLQAVEAQHTAGAKPFRGEE